MRRGADAKVGCGGGGGAGGGGFARGACARTVVACGESGAGGETIKRPWDSRHWLGLITGQLKARVTKGDDSFIRTLNDTRTLTGPAGSDVVVRARSLMLIRNVGHLMTTPAVLDAEGEPVFEGLLDAMVTVLCAMADRDRPVADRNSPAGSVYVVKPKMHGPAEGAFTAEVSTRVEEALGVGAELAVLANLPGAHLGVGIDAEFAAGGVALEALGLHVACVEDALADGGGGLGGGIGA